MAGSGQGGCWCEVGDGGGERAGIIACQRVVVAAFAEGIESPRPRCGREFGGVRFVVGTTVINAADGGRLERDDCGVRGSRGDRGAANLSGVFSGVIAPSRVE